MATKDELNIKVEFTGGLELLFGNKRLLNVQLPSLDDQRKRATVKDLMQLLLKNHIKDPRTELFIQNDSIRPGILVLINDADWELEGEEQYELQDKDNILFVSTLHGG